MDLTEAIKNAIEEKLGRLDFYLHPETEVKVTVSAKGHRSTKRTRQKVEVTIIPISGPIIRAEDSEESLYTAIDVWDNYQTFNRHSRLYKNGTLYHLFSESHKDICLRTVCANGSDIYSGGYIYDGRSHAAVWKNKELLYTLYNTSDGCWVKSIAVEGNDLYSLVQTSDKGGQFLVYKNDQLIFNTSIYSSSTNIMVNGGRVYLVLGTNKNADIIVDGTVVKSLTIPKSSGDSNLSLYEASLCGDDLYILGTCYKSPRIWQNGNLLYTLPATCTNHQYISVVP